MGLCGPLTLEIQSYENDWYSGAGIIYEEFWIYWIHMAEICVRVLKGIPGRCALGDWFMGF